MAWVYEMMSIIRGITRNFSILMLTQGIYKTLAFFTYILIARYLGVTDFGQLSFALSFVGLFAVSLDWGLSELLIRDVAGRIDKLGQRYISNILSIKLVLSILSYALVVLISRILVISEEIRFVILILTAVIVLDSFTIFFRSIFRLFERMEFEAISLVAEGLLKFGLIFMALKYFDAKILVVAYVLLLVSCSTGILTIFVSWLKFIKVKFSFNYAFYKVLFKKSLPFAFLTFFGVLNFKIDIVMISRMTNDVITGWYSAAIKIVEPLLIIPITIAVVLFPVISRLYKSSFADLCSVYKTSMLTLFLSSLPIAIAFFLTAPYIINFIFGSKFGGSILAFQILCWTLIPFFLKFFLERFIMVLNTPLLLFASYSVGTLINIVLNLKLIPWIGYAGAGIATVLSEMVIVGINLFHIRRYLLRSLVTS